jgi:hypothetical protein
MGFGISRPTDPPSGAQVEKAQPAEAGGFTGVWCRERIVVSYGRDLIPSMTTVAH